MEEREENPAEANGISDRQLSPTFIPPLTLSQEQYHWLKEAIANWRTVQRTLRRMQQLSREELFASVPGPKRRKKLSRSVLGLL